MKRVYDVKVLIDRTELRDYWIEAGWMATAVKLAERMARRVRPVQYAPRVERAKLIGTLDGRAR